MCRGPGDAGEVARKYRKEGGPVVLLINYKDNRFMSTAQCIFSVLAMVNSEISYFFWLNNEIGKID